MSRSGAAYLIATALDLALWLGVASGRIGIVAATGLHVALVAGMAALAASLAASQGAGGRAAGLPWPFLYSCLLVLGPLGGLGCAALASTAPDSETVSPSLAAWYERLAPPREVDPASELHERLCCDRAPRLSAASPLRFAHIMREGALGEKQSVLGLIGLKYTPEYLHVLKLALASSTPSVRVQAAAVHTKLREHYKRRYKAGLACLATPSAEAVARLASTGDLLTAIESGFLEAGEVRAALAACHGVRDALATVPDATPAIEASALEALWLRLASHDASAAQGATTQAQPQQATTSAVRGTSAGGAELIALRPPSAAGAPADARGARAQSRPSAEDEPGARPAPPSRGVRREDRGAALAISLPESA